jgi:hypothetical protein
MLDLRHTLEDRSPVFGQWDAGSNEYARFTPDQGGKIAIVCEWQAISSAPFDSDLQLSVIENDEVHALIFPCRRAPGGWLNAKTRQPVVVDPTHWRKWSD